jgi:TolB-like protein/DNA-binding SARP family transcriptional activator/Tfp pilus assembly protein PilF
MDRIATLSPPARHFVARSTVNRLRLFGGAAIDADSGPITGRATQRHRLALLALLSSTRRLYRGRDQLATILWPEADAERGRKLLSDSIYRINQALGGEVITGAGEEVRLGRQQLGSDVADFEAAFDAGEWRRAVELYCGPFLDGFYLPDSTDFDQWMETERRQYARAAAKAIETLAVEARDAERVTDAVDWWQRLAALAPDESRVALELMRALERAGNRAGAIRHAQLHSTLLRDVLGLEPDRAVEELAQRIAKRSDATLHAPERAPRRDDAGEAAADPERAPTLVSAAPDAAEGAASAPAHASIATARTPPVNSIAVLPFTNLSGSDANAYFADGVSEELMFLLTRTPGLRVASRTSAFACRALRLDAREVAERLNVAWLVEGSVRRAGDMLRIVAQLTDAASGYLVWSDSYDRTSSDILGIQAEIAGAIASRLASSLGGTAAAVPPSAARAAKDPDTYDLYLRARYQWHRRSEQSLRDSIPLFEQVVTRDPEYARAWVGLADTYAVMGVYDYLPPRLAFPLADSAARHAIVLDGSLAAPYATLAYVDTYFRWDWRSAEDTFRRAIELEPAYSVAHQWYSNLLVARGRFEEAEWEMRRAAELDPLSMIAHAGIGWVLIFAGAYDRAIHQLQLSLKLDPDFGLAHLWLGLAHLYAHRPTQAIPCLARMLSLAVMGTYESVLALGALARAHAAAGTMDEAEAILAGLLEQEDHGRYVSSFQLGKVFLALGDVASALSRLERAFDERSHSMVFLRVDPQLATLSSESRYRRLVDAVEMESTPPRV